VKCPKFGTSEAGSHVYICEQRCLANHAGPRGSCEHSWVGSTSSDDHTYRHTFGDADQGDGDPVRPVSHVGACRRAQRPGAR
jgi:hypothetical protein